MHVSVINSSILGDAPSLENATAEYNTNNRVGGNSSLSFSLTSVTLACHDPTSSGYSQCFHSLTGYQRQRVEFEPVNDNTNDRLDGLLDNSGNGAYSFASPLTRRIITSSHGCYDRMSCTRMMADITPVLAATDARYETQSSSQLIRDISFIATGGLQRLSRSSGNGGSSNKLDTALIYKTLLYQ
jgi:hypothetical protein